MAEALEEPALSEAELLEYPFLRLVELASDESAEAAPKYDIERVDPAQAVVEALAPGGFDRQIVPLALAPELVPEAPEGLLTISDNVTVQIGSRTVDLDPDELFIFNSLLFHRNQPVRADAIHDKGFYPQAGTHRTRNRVFSGSMRSLREKLGTEDIAGILKYGDAKGTSYQLYPGLQITDERQLNQDVKSHLERRSPDWLEVLVSVLHGPGLIAMDGNNLDVNDVRLALLDLSRAPQVLSQPTIFKRYHLLAEAYIKAQYARGNPQPFRSEAGRDISQMLKAVNGSKDWQTYGECAQAPSWWFFAEQTTDYPLNVLQQRSVSDLGKTLCAMCDVRDDCAAFAEANKERYGLWGGVTARERGWSSSGNPSRLRRRRHDS